MQNAVKIARREVGNWFATTAAGSVFLPGDGRVLPLSREEALAIRASAEEKAIAWHSAFELRAWLAIGLIVAIFVGTQSLASSLDEPWRGGVRAASYAIYSLHGLWLLWEAFEVMKQMRTLRAGIAHSLAGRVPILAERAGELGRTDPVPIVLGGLVLVLFAWNWLAEVLAHRGFDLIGIIPTWFPITFAIFVVIVAYGNRWIDRSRGVGVLPPEDLASRVRDRLDRERIGRG